MPSKIHVAPSVSFYPTFLVDHVNDCWCRGFSALLCASPGATVTRYLSTRYTTTPRWISIVCFVLDSTRNGLKECSPSFFLPPSCGYINTFSPLFMASLAHRFVVNSLLYLVSDFFGIGVHFRSSSRSSFLNTSDGLDLSLHYFLMSLYWKIRWRLFHHNLEGAHPVLLFTAKLYSYVNSIP